MESLAELLNIVKTFDKHQFTEFCSAITTFVDHDRAKTRVIDEIAAKIVGKPTPIAVQKAVETAIERKRREWAELAAAPVMEERRLAEHKQDRQRLAATLRRARKRLRELTKEITALTEKANKELASLTEEATIARQNVAIGLACSSEMPDVPPAAMTAAEWGSAIEKFAGVYFGFDGGRIQYVGESCNVPSRLRSHDVIKPHWMVAVLKLEPHQRFFAEAYYIWLMKPPLNKEGVRTLRELPSHLATFEPDTLDLADESKHE